MRTYFRDTNQAPYLSEAGNPQDQTSSALNLQTANTRRVAFGATGTTNAASAAAQSTSPVTRTSKTTAASHKNNTHHELDAPGGAVGGSMTPSLSRTATGAISNESLHFLGMTESSSRIRYRIASDASLPIQYTHSGSHNPAANNNSNLNRSPSLSFDRNMRPQHIQLSASPLNLHSSPHTHKPLAHHHLAATTVPLTSLLHVHDSSHPHNNNNSNNNNSNYSSGNSMTRRSFRRSPDHVLGHEFIRPLATTATSHLYNAAFSTASTPLAAAVANSSISPPVPDWRLREKMRTVGVGLVLALNVGTDPPDITKPHPCAVLQCWMDPRTVSRNKAKDLIGERLEQQYAKWQMGRAAAAGSNANSGKGGLRYRKALDPTVEGVRNLCLQLRRQARHERVLFHYNGHGVPRPTSNGEIWVFDKNHTEYIPLAITDLRQWLGAPSIVVLDCSAAGVLLPYWTTTAASATPSLSDDGMTRSSSNLRLKSSSSMADLSAQWVRETILLCPCAENEVLPMHPDYPADIFTSCLTTPIPMALIWFLNRNPSMAAQLSPAVVHAIPGLPNDRKTPLGELNWIFTAVTDSIAWNSLPKPLFQRLFRQDLLVASLFRNFLLADRILRTLNCTPISHPPLPPGMAQHPLWEAWDLAVETLLFQLIEDGAIETKISVSKNNNPVTPSPAEEEPDPSLPNSAGAVEKTIADRRYLGTAAPPLPSVTPSYSSGTPILSISSPFFSEQLTAFEVWLSFTEIHQERLARGARLDPPEQLPIVLQVLLSPALRVRALQLLRQFLDLGPWAVNLSLSLGIFPYVMKMLQSPEYKSLLVSIWASILSFDPSCRVDLLKDGALNHFVQHLVFGLKGPFLDGAAQSAAQERTLAAFCLAACLHRYPTAQTEAARLNLQGNIGALLSSYEPGQNGDLVDLHLPAHFRLWLSICLAHMVQENGATQAEVVSSQVQNHLSARLRDRNVQVRAAACYALGCFLSTSKSMSRPVSLQDFSTVSHGPPVISSPGLVTGPTASFQAGAPIVISTSGLSASPLQPQFTGGGLRAPLPWDANTGGVASTAGQPLPSIPFVSPMGQGASATAIPFAPSQATPFTMPSGATGPAAFLNPASTLAQTTAQPQAMGMLPPASYMLPQGAQNPMSGPSGFLVGGSPIVPSQSRHFIQPQQPNIGNVPTLRVSSTMDPVPSPIRPVPSKPTVFEDPRRLGVDVRIMEQLAVVAAGDASVTVRHEATVALARGVEKYLDAFVLVADSAASSRSRPNDAAFPMPRGLDRRSLESFRSFWKELRYLQHEDPFPMISRAANDIISVVHELVLRFKMSQEHVESERDDPMMEHTKKLANIIAGLDEDTRESDTAEHDKPSPTRVRREIHELRRVASEITTGHASLEHAARGLTSRTSASDLSSTGRMDTLNYNLPESIFYQWKKTSFDINFTAPDNEDVGVDPLSPTGAVRSFREHRNRIAKGRGVELADHFAPLIPKPQPPSRKGFEMMLEEMEEREEVVDNEATKRKENFKFSQARLLRTERQKTSMLRFHSYEDVLMACCENESEKDRVSMWNINKGDKLMEFRNGNPTSTRMTTTNWINEESSSLFLVGCDDGTVRLWGNLMGNGVGVSPSLVSAFRAARMPPGQTNKSGLVCEWQQFSGTLLAGGNSDVVHCWDLEYETRVAQLPISSDVGACVTTLTTAWDYDRLGMGPVPQGYRGIGRNIFVAGLSNGSLKIFDLRTHTGVASLESPRKGNRGSTPSSYSEHQTWVVSTAFTGYGNRYELLSGSTSGSIKFWDLRMSRSLRTIEAQRSLMTALSVHPKIPVVATGSGAQFIKILTLDGDTLQAIRGHEKLANTRIGPVSCLAFHPYKPVLAAGATDSLIGLYATSIRS